MKRTSSLEEDDAADASNNLKWHVNAEAMPKKVKQQMGSYKPIKRPKWLNKMTASGSYMHWRTDDSIFESHPKKRRSNDNDDVIEQQQQQQQQQLYDTAPSTSSSASASPTGITPTTTHIVSPLTFSQQSSTQKPLEITVEEYVPGQLKINSNRLNNMTAKLLTPKQQLELKQPIENFNLRDAWLSVPQVKVSENYLRDLLQDSTLSYEELMSKRTAPVCYSFHDMDGTLLFSNPTYDAQFGIDSSIVLGRNVVLVLEALGMDGAAIHTTDMLMTTLKSMVMTVPSVTTMANEQVSCLITTTATRIDRRSSEETHLGYIWTIEYARAEPSEYKVTVVKTK